MVFAAAASLTGTVRAREGKADGEGRKRQVVELLESIETGDPKPVAVINPKKYTQHNLAVADGLEGFGALLKQLPPNSAKDKTVRAFRDGDFVFTHTENDFGVAGPTRKASNTGPTGRDVICGRPLIRVDWLRIHLT
jgi:predicted SnoaL-like aldol condensation-catalyzing enzyme